VVEPGRSGVLDRPVKPGDDTEIVARYGIPATRIAPEFCKNRVLEE
jgi:hypothetical protein